MFDTTKEIEISLKTPEGVKTVTVEFPSDDKWISRSSKIKIVSTAIGRGKSTTDVSRPEEFNAALFDSIVKKQGDLPMDEYEKSSVIERLSKCEVTVSTYTGDGFDVTLKTPEGDTKHSVKMPSVKQVTTYKRAAVRIVEGRHGVQEITINLRASGELYDAIVTSTEGYAAVIPIIHKSAVVSEVLALLDEESSEDQINGF